MCHCLWMLFLGPRFPEGTLQHSVEIFLWRENKILRGIAVLKEGISNIISFCLTQTYPDITNILVIYQANNFDSNSTLHTIQDVSFAVGKSICGKRQAYSV